MEEVIKNTTQGDIEKRCAELDCLSYQSFINKVKTIDRNTLIPLIITKTFAGTNELPYIGGSELTQDQIKMGLQIYKGYFNKIFQYVHEPVGLFHKDFVDYFTNLGFMYTTSKTFEEERDAYGILLQHKTTIYFCAWTSKAVEYLAELEKNN